VADLAGQPEYGADVSVVSAWPYATPIFACAHRAMPPASPKQLETDELYALTAYVLYLNGLLEYEQPLDQKSLPEMIQMYP